MDRVTGVLARLEVNQVGKISGDVAESLLPRNMR